MILLEEVHKAYEQEQVLRGVSFAMEEGETLSVLGASGSGKSTLLKIMAGLESADRGSLRVEGRELLSMSPEQRRIVYLSQEPLLFPHLNVRNNLGFGLQIRRVAAPERIERIDAMAAQLGLSPHLDKKPDQLSGGQKQRVSFGRALIIRPRIVLLDEPFGSLDPHIRREMQSLFLELRRQAGITALFVTHDIKEALLMGHRVGRLHEGQLVVYPSREAFVQAPESGAKAELDFWKEWM